MATIHSNQKNARFNARLSKELKMLFEKAAFLGGYRSLTDFIVLTVQEKAKEIISEREQVLASKKDSEIFFDAIVNPPQANKDLNEAVKAYEKFLSK